jgi:predicted dienelactone hydrolase
LVSRAEGASQIHDGAGLHPSHWGRASLRSIGEDAGGRIGEQGFRLNFIDTDAGGKERAREDGRYPVIIYAPSLAGESWENASLCEFLASRGYGVLASASEGTHMRTMEGGVTGANTQARDISFLIAYAQTLPDSDMRQIAVAGYSFGGFGSLFGAARDGRVKAQNCNRWDVSLRPVFS